MLRMMHSGHFYRDAPAALPDEVIQTLLAVRDLRIEPAKVGDARVLRASGWPGPLIVSEDIKQALERLGATGTKFTEV